MDSNISITDDEFYFSRGSLPNGDDILQQEDMVKLKRCIFAAQVLINHSFSVCVFVCEIN